MRQPAALQNPTRRPQSFTWSRSFSSERFHIRNEMHEKPQFTAKSEAVRLQRSNYGEVLNYLMRGCLQLNFDHCNQCLLRMATIFVANFKCCCYVAVRFPYMTKHTHTKASEHRRMALRTCLTRLNGSVVIVVHIELFAANITTMLSDYFPILKTNTSERAPPNTNKLHDRIFGTTT